VKLRHEYHIVPADSISWRNDVQVMVYSKTRAVSNHPISYSRPIQNVRKINFVFKNVKKEYVDETSDTHGGNYEDDCLLECCDV
jgi:hypothetical protein